MRSKSSWGNSIYVQHSPMGVRDTQNVLCYWVAALGWCSIEGFWFLQQTSIILVTLKIKDHLTPGLSCLVCFARQDSGVFPSVQCRATCWVLKVSIYQGTEWGHQWIPWGSHCHSAIETLVISDKATPSLSFFALASLFNSCLHINRSLNPMGLTLKIFNPTIPSEAVHHLIPWGRS